MRNGCITNLLPGAALGDMLVLLVLMGARLSVLSSQLFLRPPLPREVLPPPPPPPPLPPDPLKSVKLIRGKVIKRVLMVTTDSSKLYQEESLE